MTAENEALRAALGARPRAQLALLPTAIHRLDNFRRALAGPELWIKRDDLTGLEGGGNKTRKLEYLVGDALASGADMLVTVGAIQLGGEARNRSATRRLAALGHHWWSVLRRADGHGVGEHRWCLCLFS